MLAGRAGVDCGVAGCGVDAITRLGLAWSTPPISLSPLPRIQCLPTDTLAAHIERLRNTLAVVPEPKTITDPVKEITVDGDRPLPDWAADDDDADLTAADVQALQPMPPTEPEMVPLAAVSRLGHVIGTALGAAATSPTVEAGIARARELLVTPTPPADDRRTRLSQYAAQFEATLAALRDWAQLTGRFTLTSEAERGLHRVLEATRSELAALNGQPHQVWGEETTI